MNKREYVTAGEACRELIRSGKHTRCTCAHVQCEWHGKCFECVMIHRVRGQHVPQCLQPILRKTIKELAGIAELDTIEARPSKEVRDYMRKVSPPPKQRVRKNPRKR